MRNLIKKIDVELALIYTIFGLGAADVICNIIKYS